MILLLVSMISGVESLQRSFSRSEMSYFDIYDLLKATGYVFAFDVV